MKTPSLKIIKEKYRNAESVKDLSTGNAIYTDLNLSCFKDTADKELWIEGYDNVRKAKLNMMIWSNKKGFAEIISYKTKEYTVDETFIKDAYNSACEPLKTKIKDKFPDVFKSELEVGKWYKRESENAIFCFNGKKDDNGYACGYGFVDSDFIENDPNDGWGTQNQDDFILATESEIKEAIKSECIKLGLVAGVKIETPDKINKQWLKNSGADYTWFPKENFMTYYGWKVFDNGKFATIINKTEVTQSDLITFYCESNNIDKDNLKVIE